MKVTLKDIADDTGYSVSTVSRVLKGSAKISAETRDEILKSARRLKYFPPRIRNANSSNHTLNIALIASGFHEGEFYVSFFHGLNKAAQKNNIRLFLLGMLDAERHLLHTLKEISLGNYDGAVLFIPEFKRYNYEQLKKTLPSQFPIISNALIENPVFSTITFDGYSGGYLAGKHFEERKYQKVGIINGTMKRAESRFRSNGFRDYVSHHSSLDLVWSFDGDFTFESGVEAFHAFEQLPEKPRAIFASNDDMCNGFMEAAKQKNYCFPDEIAILGYDDLPVCRHNQPTISSIKTDYEKLGMATMKTLREKLSNPHHKTNMLSFVPVSVKIRESS